MPTWTNQELQEYEARRIRQIGATRLCPSKFEQAEGLPLEQAEKRETAGKRRSEPCHRYHVSFTVWRLRPLDWDNNSAGVKMLQDHLVDIGLLPDDNYKVLQGSIQSCKATTKQEERTEITITRLT